MDALAGVLEDAAIGQFEVTRLVDRPTEALKMEIEGFFADARRDDLLLLYFSCHGVLSQSRRFYFATATTALNLLRATAIEDSFVNDVMQHSRARSIVRILDCCHSGAFAKGLAPKSALTVDVEHRFEGQGRVTLSASTALEYAFEEADSATELDPASAGSLFTRSVVEGLATGDADMDGDGAISVDELYDYVCQRMRERAAHQTPGMAGDVRGDTTAGACLPAPARRSGCRRSPSPSPRPRRPRRRRAHGAWSRSSPRVLSSRSPGCSRAATRARRSPTTSAATAPRTSRSPLPASTRCSCTTAVVSCRSRRPRQAGPPTGSPAPISTATATSIWPSGWRRATR